MNKSCPVFMCAGHGNDAVLYKAVQTCNLYCPLSQRSGVPEWSAWMLALSGKDWWRLDRKSTRLNSSHR